MVAVVVNRPRRGRGQGACPQIRLDKIVVVVSCVHRAVTREGAAHPTRGEEKTTMNSTDQQQLREAVARLRVVQLSLQNEPDLRGYARIGQSIRDIERVLAGKERVAF